MIADDLLKRLQKLAFDAMKTLPKVSFLATAAMTLSSHVISINSKHKFLEPQLLNELFFPARKKNKKHHIAGYFAHWLVGAFFTSGYKYLWRHKLVKEDYRTAGVLGFLNGLLGIGGWHIAFLVHKNPPVTHLKKYYLQLAIAHIVFGLSNRAALKDRCSEKESPILLCTTSKVQTFQLTIFHCLRS